MGFVIQTAASIHCRAALSALDRPGDLIHPHARSFTRWVFFPNPRAEFTGGSAFYKGWTLYAEQLAAENGWYDSDIPGHLGQLQGELFRAKRLVADTGLHTQHWTRQQAIDYGISASETGRYVMNPGQACADKIGMLKILDLRAKAQKALGEKFSLKEFHNTVLQTGNVPLAELEQVIDDYISGRTP